MKIINTQKIFDFNFVSSDNYGELIEYIIKHKEIVSRTGRYPFLVTPNVDLLVKMNEKKHLFIKDTFKNAFLVMPDGQPIIWASRLLGKKLKSRLTGSDLFPKLWKRVMQEGQKAFFICPSEEVGKFFKEEYPAAEFYAPPFFDIGDRDKFDLVKKEALKKIIPFEPDFVFLGVTFPKQEMLAIELFKDIKKIDKFGLPLFLTLGASYEFYCGMKKRAPIIFQKFGMEWFYRFWQEPRRMFKRYFIDDLKFLALFIAETKRNF